MINTTNMRHGTKLLSWLLSLAMILSLLPTAAFAAAEPPAEVKAGNTYGYGTKLIFTDTTWLAAVKNVFVNDEPYSPVASSFSVSSTSTNYYIKIADNIYDESYIIIGEGYSGNTVSCVIKADGYNDLMLELNKTTHTAIIKPASGDGGESGGDGSGGGGSGDKSTVQTPAFSKETYYYILSFSDENYVSGIEKVLVNGVACENGSSATYIHGTQYYKNAADNQLYLASQAQLQGESTFVSGDIITIQNPDYQDLVLKITIAPDGNVSIAPPDDTEGGEYILHVRLEGTFEAALVGQEDYDAISGASTSVTTNKNSNVEVQGALLPKDTVPVEEDWKPLKDTITVHTNKDKTYVTIAPEGSGMVGVYSPYDSSLTLAGTPAAKGDYEINVTVTDDQGRTAISNALSFKIYNGDETLAEQLILENCTQTADNKYMYDMEPWAISEFGGDSDVTVPQDIKAWYGSHTSGTYGKLGYAIPEGAATTQTLRVPSGCNLTLVNMDMLSSVKIVVENGGKLVLRDSVVQGIVEVEDGGTFSMNYNDFGDGEFESGASINGQLVLKDGAILENASIYSNTNNIANGTEARHNIQPVVAVQGNVTVKGQVFIRGDEAPTGTDPDTGKSYAGQTGLSVTDGTLTLADGAVLAVYGGGQLATTSVGGTAIKLTNGTITGNGKLIAIGGEGTLDHGGSAVEGSGAISTKEAYLQGGSSFKGSAAGDAITETVNLSSETRAVSKDGIVYNHDTEKPDTPRWTGTTVPDAEFMSKNYSIPVYVLMNIPYGEFYATEKGDTDTAAEIDAVSSATKSKPLNATLAAGSYHVNNDGSDITGITYPVYAADSSVLKNYTEVSTQAALFSSESYTYCELAETPVSYKAMTVENGKPVFGKATGGVQELADVTAALSTGGRHTYYEIKVTGIDTAVTDIAEKVSGVTLHTATGNIYGLRHVYEIWRGTELGFDVTGDNGDYAALQGQTIDKITYYLNDGRIYSIQASLPVPKSTKGYSITVKNALVGTGNTTFSASLPDGFHAAYTIQKGEHIQSNFSINNGVIAWTDSPEKGAYTLTAVDESNVYAPVSATFELQSDTVYAQYDASTKKIIKAGASVSDEDFQAYLKAISAVVVNEKSYPASGRGAVVLVKEDGSLDLTAAPFANNGTYQIAVKATGYQDLSFTLTIDNGNTPSPTPGTSTGSSTSSSDGSSDSGYAVSVQPSVKNGKVSASPRNAEKGDTVTITVTPNAGYELASLTVTDSRGSEISLKQKGNGTYTFTMPASKVSVKVAFQLKEASTRTIFNDVPDSAYYADAIQWAVEQGITNGTTAVTFSPNTVCTRGQIVTFLWRAMGSPEPAGTATPFVDVDEDAYYDKAVQWAVEQGITQGTTATTFAPNMTVSRSQTVTFLWRTAKQPPAAGSAFADIASDAYYADAVAWAVSQGITQGTSATTFDPNAPCTRGQIVTFLCRYLGE